MATQPNNTPARSTKITTIELPDQPAGANDLLKEIRFYALPLFSVVIFLILLIGTIIPNIQQIFSSLDEINGLKDKDTQLAASIANLTTLRDQNVQQQQIIDKLNSLVPTGQSAVVKFRERVAQIIAGQNINLSNSKSGEIILDSSNAISSAVKGLSLIQIPSEFSMDGNFTDFRSFLNKLYEGDDFFIVNEMNLSFAPTAENPNNWTSTLNLAKYQFFADPTFDSNTVYGGISDQQQPDASVINFLQTRFHLNQTTPTPTPTATP